MNTSAVDDLKGDSDLKGKDFDEVCQLIKNDKEVRGAVHKRPDGGGAGRWAFCFSFDSNEYNESTLMDLIAAEYGPGTYPVQFKSKGSGGPQVIRWHKDMVVQARRLGAQASTPTPSTPSAGTPGLDALALALDNQARILERLSEMISKPPPAVKTTIELVQELGAIKDLFSDNRQGALEQFRDAMELRKLIKDDEGDGDGDPLSMALKTLTPAIERGITALQESGEAPTRPPPAPAAESLATQVEIDAANARKPGEAEIEGTVTDVEISNETATEYAFKLFTEKNLPALLQLAETGQEPKEVATYLVRLIGSDEKMKDMIGLVIAQDDMVLRFAKANARALQFTEWLDSVADWLAHALWPATNPAPDGSSATQAATNDKTPGASVISDADQAGAAPADATAIEGQPPDAKSTSDLPGDGNSNDP